MKQVTARVTNARLVLDQPTDHPDSEELELVPLDELLARSRAWPNGEIREHLYESVGRRHEADTRVAMQEAVIGRVVAGRLVLDVPTSLAEGLQVELLPLDEVLAEGGDWLDDEERVRLHEALARSIEEAENGELTDADVVIARLRARR